MAPPDDAHASDAPAAHALPRHTTPTWEVELLISGVAVFAMLQLPGWLDDRLFDILPRFDDSWQMPLFMAYAYLKSATVILAITFALHLLLRAQWIAQVGMHSVFPAGIRWERLRIGPVQREVEIARHGSSGVAIERADNRATVVFAIGVMLASSLLLLSALFIGAFAIAIGLLHLAGIDADAANVFLGAISLVVLPGVLASGLDRRFGHRLREGGGARRALSALLAFYGRLGLLSRGSNPVFSLLSSHGGERRAMLLTTSVIALTITGVILSARSLQSPERFGSYAAFPVFADGTRTVAAAHYDDQRDPGRDEAVPFVQSAVITGPYLRLLVPYRPEGAAPGCATGGADPAARLECLQRLHAVSLDDRRLAGLRYDVASDPRTDRPALLAMIDVRALAPGRHELRVAYPPRGEVVKRRGGAGFERIPFWR